MKKILILIWICILFLFVTSAFSQNTQDGSTKIGTLTVLVDGFKSDKGNATIALCNSIEGCKGDGKAFMWKRVLINSGKAEHAFKDLPFGEYAVKVYHDENGNNKLDKNLFGIPKEAYGISNNARGTFGPPDYKKALFILDKTDMTVRVTVK